MGGEAQTALVDCYSEGRPSTRSEISVGAGQTRLLRTCDSGEPGDIEAFAELSHIRARPDGPLAISISPESPKNTLAAFAVGVLQGERGPELSGIPFTDVGMLNSSIQIFPSVPSDQSPALSGFPLTVSGAVANFSNVPQQAVIQLFANGAQTPIKTVTVPPRAVVGLDLSRAIQNLAPETALMVQGIAGPGDTVGQLEAVAPLPASELRMPLPWKDLKQKPNGGQHPWRIDRGYRSTLRLSNPDPTRPNVALMSVYSGGAPWIKRVKVDALSSVSVDINEIVGMQLKDDKGRLLPPDASQGLVSWYALSEPKIFGALVQTDTLNDVIKPFACYQTEIACGMTLDNASVGVGSSVTEYPFPLSCTGIYGRCGADSCIGGAANCSEGSPTLDDFSWTITNTGIATLSSPGDADYATLSGVSPGSTRYHVSAKDSTGCQVNGLGLVSVVGPDHVMVRSDIHGVSTCTPNCYGSVYRLISYQVVFKDNTNDNNTVPIQETLTNISTNTCGTGTPEPSGCGNAAYGQFADSYDTNYSSTKNPIPSCGFTENQSYQWCPASGPLTITHLPNDAIYSNCITVNGVTTPNGMSPGTMIH